MIERNAACYSLLQYLLYEQRQAELFKRICKANKGVSVLLLHRLFNRCKSTRPLGNQKKTLITSVHLAACGSLLHGPVSTES